MKKKFILIYTKLLIKIKNYVFNFYDNFIIFNPFKDFNLSINILLKYLLIILHFTY